MDDSDLQTLGPAIRSGVPLSALAVHARWWQMERYLREIVYTELRAALGSVWTEELDAVVPKRAADDQINSYMATADADEVLAYADASVLFKLIDRHWDWFEPILLPKARWDGLVDTLRHIRHRSAHCRRPHRDDLGRLEQALRDLEAGARRFYGSYGSVDWARQGKDPLIKAWVDERHEAAARLIEHCSRNYGTTFRLGHSLRPWASEPENDDSISGTSGILWQSTLILGETRTDPETLWAALSEETRDLVVHCLFGEHSVDTTFAATDDPGRIADAIGEIFDATISTRPLGPAPGISDPPLSAEHLPPKAQLNSALALFDPLNPGAFTLFSA